MAGTTALLRSAQSTQKKIAEQQDAQVAYDYSLSAKTYADFVEYSKYLDSRRKDYTGDSSKLLTIEKTVNSARKAYVANEIQRSNIDIIEGRSSNPEKYQKLVDLFHQAVDNGDYDQATSLNLQLDNLSVKIQNEADAAAKQFAASGAKANDDLMNALTKGVRDVTLPDGSKVTPLAAVAQYLEKGGAVASGAWEAANQTMQAIRESVINQWTHASSQDELDKLEQKYGAGLENLNSELTFKVGGKSLTADQVYTANENEKINNPIYTGEATYNEATGKNEFKLKENNVDRIDYTRQIDPATGQEYFAPTTVRTDQNKLMFGNSDQGRGLGTQLTNEGYVIGDGDKTGSTSLGTGQAKRQAGQSINDRLKNLGIIATQNGTTLEIKLPGESISRRATIQPDGSIRYIGDGGQIKEIGLVDRNLGSNDAPLLSRAGEIRDVSPDEISDFAQGSSFGGTLSKASAQGANYVRNYTSADPLGQLAPHDLRNARLTGVTNIPSLNGGININNDFSGRGAPVTSGLLQSANFTQRNVQSELQAKATAIQLQAQQEAAQRLQASANFNLNQTPVQQFAQNGVLRSQLRVAPLPQAPRVVVAPPAPTPRISGVGVAQPGRITSVGVL